MAAIDNVLRRDWKYPATQMCASCRTDWSVSSCVFAHVSGARVRLVVRSWRDLGDGRDLFDGGWRAHGVGRGWSGGDVVRNGGMRDGDVRRAFEAGGCDVVCGSGRRAVSPARRRIYGAFMRTGSGEGDVRRSRRRSPRVSEDLERREEDEEMYREEQGL